MTVRRIDVSRVADLGELIPLLQQVIDDVVQSSDAMVLRRISWAEDGSSKLVEVEQRQPRAVMVNARDAAGLPIAGVTAAIVGASGYNAAQGSNDVEVSIDGLTSGTTYELDLVFLGEVN
tara:strand:+ start:141 stop:500 length:360 start_codon:yes stop_codon:yes gene_type:complete